MSPWRGECLSQKKLLLPVCLRRVCGCQRGVDSGAKLVWYSSMLLDFFKDFESEISQFSLGKLLPETFLASMTMTTVQLFHFNPFQRF